MNNAACKEVSSRKILAIRAKALEALGLPVTDRCPTCMHAAAVPYRRHDANGHITEGCVDAHHTPALEGLSLETRHWHFRTPAVTLRGAELARLARR